MDEGEDPTTSNARRARNMLKRTYALGLLAAATLGCFLTPATQASQVEVNKQTGSQMPQLLVLAPFSKTLTNVATRTNGLPRFFRLLPSQI